METLYQFILIHMVYLAFAIFIGGTVVRLFVLWRQPKNTSRLRIYQDSKPKWYSLPVDVFLMPTVRKHKPVLWIFLMAFHICILLAIIGHLELFASIGFIQIIPHQIFLGGGFVGVILAICLLLFLFRRFISPVKDLSVPEDYFLLILLFLTVIFGSEMDWARNWYGYATLGVEDYRQYLMSLLMFQPEMPFMFTQAAHSFMLVLHVFFANVFLMFFPFSKIMHSFLSLPVNSLKRT